MRPGYGGSTTLSYLTFTDQGPALSYNSPAALAEIYLNIASCFTAYCRAAHIELDLEITAGSYNAKVNLSCASIEL